MIIIKGFKTCVVIDNREGKPTAEYKHQVSQRFLDRIVDGDLICKIEIFHHNKLIETISNGVEGGLICVDGLKQLKIN